MRGYFGGLHPRGYPTCVLISLPIKDFISSSNAAKEAEKSIVRSIKQFNINSTDRVIIACNTAHLLQPFIEKESGIKLESLVEATKTEIKKRNVLKIGILASPASLKHDLHGLKAFERFMPSDLKNVEETIRDVVNGKISRKQVEFLQKEVSMMIEKGAEAIVLGCSEFEMLFHDSNDSRFIRPLELTIRNTLESIK